MARKSRQRSLRAHKSAAFGQPPESALHELLGQPLRLLSMFLRVSDKLGLDESWLVSRDDESQSLLLLTHGEPGPRSRLVIAGTHGDEPAGVLALLALLFSMQLRPSRLRQAGPFALVPLLSPSASELQTRCNLWDEDPNRGFAVGAMASPTEPAPGPSREGQILVDNLPLLARWARAATLALHEDCDAREFYLYAFNEGEEPCPLARRLRDTGGKGFGVVPDADDFEGSRVRDGIIFNHFVHGALDELLFEKTRAPVIVTETPGLRSLDDRAETTLRILERLMLDFRN